MLDLSGRTIGNYVVTQKIGEGGMGVVYLAHHVRLSRRAAIKVLLPELNANAQAVARFFNEAEAANKIGNEHIVDIIDFGNLEDGTSYITMEYLDGKPLSTVLEEQPRLPLARALHITRGIGRALAAAHTARIIHRDLKPNNVFLVTVDDDPDFVKVLDFGIAKLTGQTSMMDVKTQTGALIGTPLYMSPEQCRGVPIGTRSDIYSLAVITFQMLTGRLPFEVEGLGELLLAHMTQPPPRPRDLEPSIPASVEAAILHALEKSPEQRFTSIEAYLRALESESTGPYVAEGQPTQAMRSASPAETLVPATPSASGVVPKDASANDAASPRGRRPGLLVALGLGAPAAALGIYFAATASPPPVDTASAQGSSPVAAAPGSSGGGTTAPAAGSLVPAPVAATPPAPQTATISIKASPPEAQITLDDAPVANPFVGTFPRGDVRHRVVVKARGHRSEAAWVLFDEDRELEYALKRGSGTHEGEAGGQRPTSDKTAAVPTSSPSPSSPPSAQPGSAETEPTTTTYKGTKGKLITTFPDE